MFRENLNIFLNESELAIAAVLIQDSVSKTIKVFFDKAYQQFTFNAEGRSILATAKTSDLGSVKHGDTLVIETVTYTITNIQPIDDAAFTELGLRE